MQRLAIAGVGLIGGSFALALRESGIHLHVTAIDLGRSLARALELGVIDDVLPLEQACATADVVYIALPIAQILELLPRIAAASPAGTLVTDAGSTKREIASRAAALFRPGQFLGGHPMAGKETRGVNVAEPTLFLGRPYLLTPTEPAHLETGGARTLLSWIQAIGAIPAVMTPEEHDRTVALTSHLPQLLATALASLLDGQPERQRLLGAAGPGLLDSTRLALSSWTVWADILATNRDAIEAALRAHAAQLDLVRELLDRPEQMSATFERARAFAEDLRNSKSGN